MALGKRKFDGDLVYTISDNESVGDEEKEHDSDYDFDSDFEWQEDSGPVLEDPGWGFEAVKHALHGRGTTNADEPADLDDILRKRREARLKKARLDAEAAPANDEEGEAQGSDSPDKDEDVDEQDATARPFQPVADDVDEGSDDDDSSDSSDAEEQAKRADFFADEDDAPGPGAQPKSRRAKKKAAALGGQLSFQDMNLSRPLMRGLTSVGYTNPTPVQARAIPLALAGRDVVAGAVTGSGKTAAFMVPVLERLLHRPRGGGGNAAPTTRVVVLTPTRELAMQCHAVAVKLAAFMGGPDAVRFCLAVGGLSLKLQEAELRRRPDVVIATPGRFIDHVRNSASVAVDRVEILVLDEADRMLEDGFQAELDEILMLVPKSRQTMLFSATMTSKVDELVRVGLRKPVRVMVDSEGTTAGGLTQEFVRLRRGQIEKRIGYLLYLCNVVYKEKVIIFFQTKVDAHRTRVVFGLMGIPCAELHGSMTQTQRIASLEQFRDGKKPFLLATDLASRGLDIKGVYTVINYDAPRNLETYLHRVGRTARAGRSGTSCTIITREDLALVKEVRKVGKKQSARVTPRAIPPAEADKWQSEVDSLEDEIKEALAEEQQLKELAQAEMQVRKGENMIIHEAEIKGRPRRTWFETTAEKTAKAAALKAKDKSGDKKTTAVEKLREKLKAKTSGRLSNKDRKALDNKADREAGKEWGRKKTKDTRGKDWVGLKNQRKQDRGKGPKRRKLNGRKP